MLRKRVLSGIRATGRLHLGNYLGAVKGMLTLQGDPEYETLYMIADLHTMTTPYDRKTIGSVSREVVLDYLACGLDPKKSVVFVQSDLAELHTQLAFLFSTVTTIARMQHLPTFKEKVRQYPEYVTMALLNYPVLMAADILIYKASQVPVGIDQEPHLEVAREIARKMNSEYGTDFPQPTRFATKGEYVPSLLGEGKMSKTVEGSYINLTDDLDSIKKRLAAAPTDVGKGEVKSKVPPIRRAGKSSSNSADRQKSKVGEKIYVSSGKRSHGVESLLQLIELFEGKNRREEYEKQYVTSGIQYKDLKAELASAIYKELKPIQEKRRKLERDSEYVEGVIHEGAEMARKIAAGTVREVREKMGLR